MSKFKENVYKAVRLIPSGYVASYGQVALYVGAPRAARQVGWMLNLTKDSDQVPWWRVINNEGRISIKSLKYSADEQRGLLLAEGIKVFKNMTIDIEKYRFLPDEVTLSKLEIDPLVLDKILSKIPFSKGYFKTKK